MNTEQPQKDLSLQVLITEGKNPRGIPAAKFIENVDEFLGDAVSVETAIGAFNELYSKYKYMETQFEKSKSVYKSKLPEIDHTLELVKVMIAKQDESEDMLVDYNLSDTVYTKAKVDTAAGVVYLWIGAGTMVEYSYPEALALLQSQREATILRLQENNEDLNFLRSNSITVEVNMARLFNHSVKLKKIKEAAATGK